MLVSYQGRMKKILLTVNIFVIYVICGTPLTERNSCYNYICLQLDYFCTAAVRNSKKCKQKHLLPDLKILIHGKPDSSDAIVIMFGTDITHDDRKPLTCTPIQRKRA